MDLFAELKVKKAQWGLRILKKIWMIAHAELETKYKRTLPFGEYIVDRWEKARLLKFGEKSSIYDSSIVYGNVNVGKNTWIGPFTILDGAGAQLTIGDNCAISAGVQIYTHDTVKWAVSGGEEKYEYAAVEIGNNCFIGPNSVITKGVKIGEGCIIGAGSIVFDDIPDYTKAFGVPCRCMVSTRKKGLNPNGGGGVVSLISILLRTRHEYLLIRKMTVA